MAGDAHPLAPHHLPSWIPAADGSDLLMSVVIGLVAVAAFGLGVFYFSRHSLPERLAHKASHAQLQLITILTLLALFTHQHLFWVAALVLAVVQFPDYSTPLQRIAAALTRDAPPGGPAEAEAKARAQSEAAAIGAEAAGHGRRTGTEGA